MGPDLVVHLMRSLLVEAMLVVRALVAGCRGDFAAG